MVILPLASGFAEAVRGCGDSVPCAASLFSHVGALPGTHAQK